LGLQHQLKSGGLQQQRLTRTAVGKVIADRRAEVTAVQLRSEGSRSSKG
jgi:hypothetical protein